MIPDDEWHEYTTTAEVDLKRDIMVTVRSYPLKMGSSYLAKYAGIQIHGFIMDNSDRDYCPIPEFAHDLVLKRIKSLFSSRLKNTLISFEGQDFSYIKEICSN